MACSLHRMGDHQNGLPHLIDFGKLIQKVIRSSGIQCPGRLIRQDQLRLCNQSSRHRRPLFLTAGYFIRELGK